MGSCRELGHDKLPPSVTVAVIAVFDKNCQEFGRAIAALPNLKTSMKHPHPWFGLMDAAGWHFMADFHMELHLKQMQLIRRGLS
jgi:hypothetical protein